MLNNLLVVNQISTVVSSKSKCNCECRKIFVLLDSEHSKTNYQTFWTFDANMFETCFSRSPSFCLWSRNLRLQKKRTKRTAKTRFLKSGFTFISNVQSKLIKFRYSGRRLMGSCTLLSIGLWDRIYPERPSPNLLLSTYCIYLCI